MRSGSRMTAAATTGPASGPRPASSQPATGQMPFASARRSRRNVGRRISSTSGRRSTFSADLAAVRLMRAILRAHALKSNETEFRPRMTGTKCPEPLLVRKDQPAILRKCEARSLHHLPDVAVRIDKISSVAAVFGFLGTAQQTGANRHRLLENGIDLGGGRAIPSKRRAPKRLRPGRG